jgi:glycosyltransferase involved in cell wall biosynthesis
MDNMAKPIVSCIMPTCNRRAFVSNAILYFQRQDYENKELVIVDDGEDCIEDLVPVTAQIRYSRISRSMTLGEKRNFCIRESKGDLIMHWDDDDWMADYRISYQVRELLEHGAEICGLKEMLFCELETGNCWLYKYPRNARSWLAGGSLLYTRDFWKKGPFPDMQVASDTQFIFARELESFVALTDHRFYVASIHGKNTSPRRKLGNLWDPVHPTIVKNILGEDWSLFLRPGIKTNADPLDTIVSKKKIAILVTTCDRPAFLERIIRDLQQEGDVYDLSFFIVDDGVLRNGKKNYWKTTNELWKQARSKEFDYYIQLPDDVELQDQFISKAINSWNAIEDAKKICLNLFLDGVRLGKTCWTNFWPQVYVFNEKIYLRTQWVDMFYICEKKFFEQLSWSIHAVDPRRWINNPELSSGVGQQISIRLHTKGWHLYQVKQSMAEHISVHSIMNPGIRKKEPMRSAELPFIYAGMASIPGREAQLKIAISSILPYVDQLFLFLNEYSHIPPWLLQLKKVTPYLSWQEKTNMGDAGKFFGLNKIPGDDYYYFTLDDDMVYPPGYTWKMIEKIEKHHRRGVVGCGGYIMKAAVNHFYTDRQSNWHITTLNSEDRSVHILHSCLTAWHSSALDFRYEDCSKPNMGDIWLGIAAQKKQAPMILIERPANWVRSQPVPLANTIYGRYKNNCREQTDVYNSWREWKLIPVKEKKPSSMIGAVG